ncbi:Leucine-rich repeat domain, L domain-like [Phytophthora cactorum]|nr:Leucine-rich repeat domain, L domain-like [Phytophthora cactorum]
MLPGASIAASARSAPRMGRFPASNSSATTAITASAGLPALVASSKDMELEVIRACPACRLPSDFIVPSLIFVTGEEKRKVVEAYKSHLALRECKYFNGLFGSCPFGPRCFYAHRDSEGRDVKHLDRPKRSTKSRHGRNGRQGGDAALQSLLQQYSHLFRFFEVADWDDFDLVGGLYDSDDSDDGLLRVTTLQTLAFKPPPGCLPAELSVFTKLRVLGLAGNALTTLPEGLNQLTDLEVLCLEKNRLRTVPVKVAFPPKLRELRLDSNQLSTFPTQITKLRLLNRLGLSHNQLKTVPEQIHLLRNLVELDLDYNRINGDLPDGLAALQRLERIGLKGNFLAERPAILDRLPVLSYIRLSGNRAKQFLPTTNSIEMGSTRQLLAVPKRHDGYFQCVESSNKIHNEDGGTAKQNENQRYLEGLVPCRDQNILNTLTY